MSTAVDAREPLEERLVALRDRYVVGRTREIELFQSLLTDSERPHSLVRIHGPGGVGKSVLVRRYARLARARGAPVVSLDARDLEPTPLAVLAAVGPLAELARGVLLVDTAELLDPLDGWLRDVFLPRLPASTLVVTASRTPPSPAWRADPAWSQLSVVLPLRNLEPADSRAYLHARGLPDHQHAAVLDFTYGHPLALSLLTDRLLHGGPPGAATLRTEDAPDIVRALLERVVDDVPSALHWQALAVCAHSRATTEDLLAATLGQDHAPELFQWLCAQPFVELGPRGLFPHDLAREVLDADLRWRDPATYRRLHDAICDWCVSHLHTRDPGQQAAYFDFLYLLRHSIRSRDYYDWESFGHLYAEAATPEDHAPIIALVERHEGAASARLAEYWLHQQPEAFVVFRASGTGVSGFTAALLLDERHTVDAQVDPAIAAAFRYVAAHGPLRPGEVILHHRFFIGRDGYQDLATHNMVALVATTRWLTTPHLAWSFPCVAQPEQWQPMFEPVRFVRAPEADFEVGGRVYGAFAHDWRVDPPRVWIKHKVALESTAAGPSVARAPIVLSRPDFESAVRQALRDVAHQRAALGRNPLVRSRLAIERAADGEPTADTVRDLLVSAADDLRGAPRGLKLFRALDSTFFQPAATQERAAERLGLPFNTYRYQLAAAIRYVSNWLWERELAA